MLSTGDRLVFNDTKVVPARLIGRRTSTGGQWQGLFLRATPEGHWWILQKTRGRLKQGETITLVDRDNRDAHQLLLIEPGEGGQWLAHPVPEASASDLLTALGRVPLPPYIRGGNMVDTDVERYQTIYAKREGAVAAPTAGLHFTRRLLERLDRRGVGFSTVTLHVGLDTFRPISGDSLAEHQMHTEWCELSDRAAAEIMQTRSGGRPRYRGRHDVRSRAGISRSRKSFAGCGG